MRFILFSDTHIGGRYDEMILMKGIDFINSVDGDIFIHCGDLTGSGTLAEYEIARLYLEKIKKKPFFIVPGNHDCKNVGDLLFEEIVGDRFWVKTLEDKKTKILGLDSTEPDANTGRMGPKSIKRIYEEFADLPEYWLKVLVFHHQTLPIPYTGRERSAIKDAGDVVKAILDCNIHLVFNGHRHISNVYKMSDGVVNAWIINVGTLSCKKTRYREEYSLTVVDASLKKNNLAIRSILLKKEPVREVVKYSGKFQRFIAPMNKKHLATIIQIGNTAFSNSRFRMDNFYKGIETINLIPCDVVVHCGEVTGASYVNEFQRAKALLSQIEKPLIVVPGDNDAFPLGWDLFPEYIGDPNPYFENEKLIVKGFNTCLIDEQEGRLGRGNTKEMIRTFENKSKIGVVTFHHSIIPLPHSKHDAELIDSGDVLSAIVNHRINLVLTGAKNRSGCWQVNDTVFVNAGTLSSENITTRYGNSFNIITISQTDKGKLYEIDEYFIETNQRKTIGVFHISDKALPIRIPDRSVPNTIHL
ncbi:MAG: metallophosphoesterase family protein [Candidatus Heimdallarchaeaceae archaeon]